MLLIFEFMTRSGTPRGLMQLQLRLQSGESQGTIILRMGGLCVLRGLYLIVKILRHQQRWYTLHRVPF